MSTIIYLSITVSVHFQDMQGCLSKIMKANY